MTHSALISAPQVIAGQTAHARRGSVRNSFRYGVDYVLIDPESRAATPALFSRNGLNLTSVRDLDHGGPSGQGQGAAWARRVLAAAGLDLRAQDALRLLTQPRFLGYGFNPVSFWLVWREGALIAAIADVTNTFRDRHSYLCAHPDFAPILPADRLRARKLLHVSPFQQVAGDYRFAFDIKAERLSILIDYRHGDQGVLATLTGARAPMSNRAIARAALRRPFGPLRVMALIHAQALRLKLRGAVYRRRPAPPTHEVS